MANAIYNEYKYRIDEINWADNTNVDIKAMLVDNTYAPDIDAHSNKSDIDALSVEISGTGYTAGGASLQNRAKTKDLTNDWGVRDADDVTWANSTLTARGAILYLDTGDASTSTLVCYVDFGADKSSSNGDFLIQWDSNGIFRIA